MFLKFALLAGALAALEFCAQPISVEVNALPKDVQKKIVAMGYKVDGKKMVALLKPLQPASPPPGVTIVPDVSYGDDPLQKFDIYRPEGKDLPIAVFVHGGGFIGGDKNESVPFYGNVTAYLARHDILALNVNYRLAPKVQWPVEAQDVGTIVAWLKKNAAQYGGDLNRIVLIGHSAGATNVAQYTLDASLHPTSGPGVAGAVLISGIYRDSRVMRRYRAYFGDDVSQYTKRLPAARMGEIKTSFLFVTAEYDPPSMVSDASYLAARICAHDSKCPPLVSLKGHNHLSEVMTIGSKDEAFGQRLVDFVKTVR